jgi:hypothetical protein
MVLLIEHWDELVLPEQIKTHQLVFDEDLTRLHDT